MAPTEITKENFRAMVDKEGIVFLDWWAPWCPPCRMFGPIYERVAAKHPDIVFGKINTEEEIELAAANDIRSIPTLMILRDGVMLFSQPGALPEATLSKLVAEARNLDMTKVRQELETTTPQQSADAGSH
jgi:thioredoxin 1